MGLYELAIKAAKEALEEMDASLPDDIIENIVAWVSGVYENPETLVYMEVSNKPEKDNRQNEKLLKEIERLNREIGVYANSVKSRRRCTRVWIEHDCVMYM